MVGLCPVESGCKLNCQTMAVREGTRRTKVLRYNNICALLALLTLLACAQPALAQGIRLRYDAFGNKEYTNPATGRSAVVPSSSAPAVRNASLPASARESAYDDFIVEHARLNNLRPDLIRAVVRVESGFNPYAQSSKGALGLMQLMPATARQFNVSNPFDPEQNIRGGSSYLRQLLDRYDNNEALALAAYNAGPGAVDKYGPNIPPYRETQHYVSRVSEMAFEVNDVVKKAGTRFYKIVEVIDGREIKTYSNIKPR